MDDLPLLTVTALGHYAVTYHKTSSGTPPVKNTAGRGQRPGKPEKSTPQRGTACIQHGAAGTGQDSATRFDIALNGYVVQAEKSHDPGFLTRLPHRRN